MLHIRKIITYLLAVFFSFNLMAQVSDTTLIQLSGVVVDGDSLTPMPFTSIIDKQTKKGTVSDFYGYYSFVTKLGDTVEFSFVGYKKSYFIIPDTLSKNRYSLIHVMEKDTIVSKPVNVYPWPSREDFANYFVNHEPMADELRIARGNLAGDKISKIAISTPTGSSIAYKWNQQQFQDKLYYNGGTPSINLLNPLAWAKFIDYWKKGKFKRKK